MRSNPGAPLPQEARRRMTALMVEPARCAGANYDEQGRLYHIFDGHEVPESVVIQGLSAVRAYLEGTQ